MQKFEESKLCQINSDKTIMQLKEELKAYQQELTLLKQEIENHDYDPD